MGLGKGVLVESSRSADGSIFIFGFANCLFSIENKYCINFYDLLVSTSATKILNLRYSPHSAGCLFEVGNVSIKSDSMLRSFGGCFYYQFPTYHAVQEK